MLLKKHDIDFRHQKISSKIRKMLYCFLGYPDFLSVQEGLAPIGNTGRWKCLRCMKEFSTKRSTDRHYRDAHLSVNQTCELCGIEVKNLTCLQEHVRQKHGVTLTDLKKRVLPSAKY